jgi:6-phosphofructokinase 1
VKLDIDEAWSCGTSAVKRALKGESGVMVTIERARGKQYRAEFGTIPLAEVANRERPMPDSYIAEGGMDVTPAFLKYARPLVGEVPEYANLKVKQARP